MDQRENHESEPTIHDEPYDDDEPQKPTPLPKLQLFIVYLIQFSEPITALVIYPFVNQFVQRTGITGGDEAKTGYYAGIIESLFFLAECLTVVQWGMLSDRFGRRPILLIGPLGLSFAMLAFGISTKYWGLVVSRTLQGTFNGNIGVSKSVIAEITDSTNIADAYSYITLMWSSGSTLAPVIGGVLAEPAKRWPDTIGKIALFRDHPYFLPCLVSGIIAFGTYVFAGLHLKESLPSIIAQNKLKQRRIASEEEGNLLNGEQSRGYGATAHIADTSETPTLVEESSDKATEPIPFKAIFTRRLFMVLANQALMVFIDMGNFVLLPLVFSTSVKNGGLGLDAFHIGTFLASFGFINAFVQAKYLGPTIRRFGPKTVFRVGITSFVIPYTIYPLERYFAQKAGHADSTVYALIVLHLASAAFIYGGYASYQILLVEAVPKGGPLATANGLSQMISSGLRTVAPTFASSLFSISIQKNILGGNLVFYTFIGMAVCGSAFSTLLPESPTARPGLSRNQSKRPSRQATPPPTDSPTQQS